VGWVGAALLVSCLAAVGLAQPKPVPLLIAIDPQTVPPTGEHLVTLSGLFSDGDQVEVDGEVVPSTWQDDFTITLLVSGVNADGVEGPAADVRVRNASGRSQRLQLFVGEPRVGFVLGAAIPFSVPTVPSFVSAAQLNADGRPDLVYVTSAPDAGLYTAFANAAGGFDAPIEITLAEGATHVVVADVDNDNDDDLLAARGGVGLVTVLANDGSGDFLTRGDVTTGLSSGPAIAVADLDGDGDLDFVVVNTVANSIGIHLGAGDGTFTSQPAVATLAAPISPVLGDINRDGALDVIVLSSQTGDLSRHLGTGNGTFAAAVSIPVANGTSPGLESGDVNADGLLDLVFPRQPPFSGFPFNQVLLGQANGTFIAPPPPPGGQPVLPLMRSLDLTDADGDGDQDLVSVDALGSFYVLRGDRSGGFTVWVTRALGLQPLGMVAADVSGDGLVDFLVAGNGQFPAVPRLALFPQADPGPPPQLVLPDATFTETDSASTSVSMPVLVVDANGQPTTTTVPITITLAFEDGTARRPQDYNPSPASSFVIPAGATQGTIDFRIGGGTTFEPTETFTVRIATADAAVIRDGTATVTILDNDPPPPSADLVTTLTMDDDLGPGEPFTGMVTLRNNGPAAASNVTAAIQIDSLDLAKLSNIQITSSTFLVSGVNGGLIRGQSLALPSNQELSFTFTATPTATATAPVDLAFTENDTQLFPLSYAFNQLSSSGRIGMSFDQAGDGKVNDLLLFDPATNLLRVVTNADGPPQTQVVDMGTAFPTYSVSSINVCRLGESSDQSALMTLVRAPGVAGDEGLVVSRNLTSNAPVAPPTVVMRNPDSPLLGTVCDNFFVNGVNDVAAFGPNHVIVARNTGGVLVPTPPIATYTTGAAHGMVGGDFNGDGINDIAVLGELPEFVIDGRVGAGTVLLPLEGDGAGGFTPGGLLDLSHLGHVPDIVGGTGFDPVANSERPFDLNRDGFPDLVAACTRCAPGGTYGLVPLRNRGSASPGEFDVQSPIAVGEAGRPHGAISMLGTPLVNETLISLAATDGFNSVVDNTTPPNATTVTLDVRGDLGTRRAAGSGPSDVVALNAFNDAELDFDALSLGGRIGLQLSGSGTGTVDPDQSNNLERRTVVFRPGRPDSHQLQFSVTWTPNEVARLQNTAPSPSTNSLGGARVYIQDQQGNTADAHVLSTSDAGVTFVWPLVPGAFRIAGAQLTLYAETAGGRGASTSTPVIEEEEDDLPVLSIADSSGGETGESINTISTTLTLSKPSDVAVRVRLTTLGGTADVDVDFLGSSVVVEIPPGDTTMSVPFLVFPDALDEADETFIVRLSEVEGATLGDAEGQITILDDDDPPYLQLSNLRVAEGDAGTVRVPVIATLVGPPGAPNAGQQTTSGKTITLNVTAGGGTATTGTDYSFQPNMFILAPGESTATLQVDVHGDTAVEPDESVHFDIVAINVTVPAGQDLVIENDDEPPVLTIRDVLVDENLDTPDGPRVVTTVVLSKPSDTPVRVRYTTADGTAFGTIDYVEASGVIEIPAGQTTAEIETYLKDDLLAEPTETYFINLSDAVGATIGDAQGMVFIRDDDEAGDTTPPTLVTPPNVTVPAVSDAGTVVQYPSPIVSDDQPGATATCSPPSGSVFPIGTTTVTCTATDASGNTVRGTFTVTVDVGQPRIEAHVVGQRVTGPGQHVFDLAIRNAGTGHAREVRVLGVRLRVLRGTGAAALGNFGPIDLGNLDVNEVKRIELNINTKATVERLAITTEGTMKNVRLDPELRFIVGTSVIVNP
jgi:hypothetical protein